MSASLLDNCLLEYTLAKQHGSDNPLSGSSQSDARQFTVYNSTSVLNTVAGEPLTAFPCRVNYKISLLNGYSRAEYADKVITIKPKALLFSTPKVPFYWLPQDGMQSGAYSVFTADFLAPIKSGVVIDELPIFKAGGHPVFQLSDDEADRVQTIFLRMQEELNSDYAYKYDLLRTYVLELIHFGQKLQPAAVQNPVHGASARVSSLFAELLERQFPIEKPDQQLRLRTAKDYADQLAVHVNHLNKVLKETTGRTTTELIGGRVMQEAQLLLRQPNWTLTEIADSLGFTDTAHFSKAFKQQTTLAPGAYRHQMQV